MPHTIILAHGILGFGADLKVRLPAQYFNGVAAHLEEQGHRVFAPSVDPIGSIAKRGRQLAERILEVPLEPGEKLHVIAYSMGGLDARGTRSRTSARRASRSGWLIAWRRWSRWVRRTAARRWPTRSPIRTCPCSKKSRPFCGRRFVTQRRDFAI